jgi:hypothetical protein
LGFGVWGLGFEVWGLRFGVWGLGFGVWGLKSGVEGSWGRVAPAQRWRRSAVRPALRAEGFGSRVEGLKFRVWS